MQKLSLRINLLLGTLIAISFCMLSPVSFALRDPTQPEPFDTGDEGDFDSLVVKMIKFNQGQAVANVNDKIVKVGDEINGMKVTAIEHDVVSFRTVDNSVFSIPIWHYVVEKNVDKTHENKK